MAARGATPRITWGASFANVIEFGGPVEAALNYERPAEGSEFDGVDSSGEADSWIYGPDQLLEATVRWIPMTDTRLPVRATGWDGWAGAPDNLNLLANGSFEAALTDSWSSLSAAFTRINTDPAPPQGTYVLDKSGAGSGQSAHRIPVTPGATYDLRALVKRVSTGSDAPQYLGVSCFNARNQLLNPFTWYAPNGLATDGVLAADVVEGATTVTLVDASGYPDESGSGFNTYVALGALPLGADIPNLTVLRYQSKSGNVLTLQSAVPAGVSALRGSATRFHRSGSNHIYCLLGNVLPSTLSTSWVELSATIGGGEILAGATAFGLSAFAPGTRYLSVYVQGNGTEVLRYDDFRLTRLGPTGLGWRAFLAWAREANVFRWYPDVDHPAVYYPMRLVEPLTDSGLTLERGSRHRALRLVMRTSDRSVLTGY